MASTLDPSVYGEVMTSYRKSFDAMDPHNDGYVDIRKMCAAGRSLGHRISHQELMDCFGKTDIDSRLTFEEFVSGMLARVEKNKSLIPVRDRFRKFDYRRRGFLTADDLYPILKDELGFDMNKTESLVDMYDKNKDYRLSVYEFADFIKRVDELKEEIQRNFNEFDTDQDGYVSFSEAMLKMSPKGFTEEMLKRMFDKYDSDGDGRLDYKEFAIFWDIPIF